MNNNSINSNWKNDFVQILKTELDPKILKLSEEKTFSYIKLLLAAFNKEKPMLNKIFSIKLAKENDLCHILKVYDDYPKYFKLQLLRLLIIVIEFLQCPKIVIEIFSFLLKELNSNLPKKSLDDEEDSDDMNFLFGDPSESCYLKIIYVSDWKVLFKKVKKLDPNELRSIIYQYRVSLFKHCAIDICKDLVDTYYEYKLEDVYPLLYRKTNLKKIY